MHAGRLSGNTSELTLIAPATSPSSPDVQNDHRI
jgi:hypothetical protein